MKRKWVRATESNVRSEFLMRVAIHGVDACWEWIGPKLSNGYGLHYVGGKKRMLAHRYSYAAFRGPIVGGLHVLHHCDNRCCVRPSHLFLGTPADNAADKVRKGRQRNYRILTPDQVTDIRARTARGEPARLAAVVHGVSTGAIYSIRKGKTWVSHKGQ